MTSPPVTSAPSLAAAAFRQGLVQLGVSFRMGRPRGSFCHAGWCQQCKVALSDGRVGLACRLPASDLGLLRRSPNYRLPLGLLARRLRPWFHERVLLPSPILQQSFLRAVRYASAALPLTSRELSPGTAREATCDALVIGGGRSGLAAAAALRAAGIDVLSVDEQPAATTGNEQPWHYAETLAVGLYHEDGRHSALCSTPSGSLTIRFRRLVVATGSYDRLLPIPGNDLPGIIGLEAFERLVSSSSLPPGVVLGLFAPAMMTRRAGAIASAAGLRFAWAAGAAELSDDLAEFAYPGRYPLRAQGNGRLKNIELSDGRRLRCDVLVVGYKQPTYEFQMQAGQVVDYGVPGSPVTTKGEANLPLLVVGDAAGLTESSTTELVRERVAAWLGGASPAAGTVEFMPQAVDLADEVVLCPCEDVRVGDLRVAIRDGFDSVEHVKRRTGAGTGPCQGKLCHPLLLRCLADAGLRAELPTIRPFVRPVPLASFAEAQR